MYGKVRWKYNIFSLSFYVYGWLAAKIIKSLQNVCLITSGRFKPALCWQKCPSKCIKLIYLKVLMANRLNLDNLNTLPLHKINESCWLNFPEFNAWRCYVRTLRTTFKIDKSTKNLSLCWVSFPYNRYCESWKKLTK